MTQRNEEKICSRTLGCLSGGILLLSASLAPLHAQPRNNGVGEQPVITEHLDQNAINEGRVSFQQLFEAGQRLFTARFNVLDGQGRPAATGQNNPPTPRTPDPAGPSDVLSTLTRPQPERAQNSTTPALTRVSGPTTNSCAGCHFQPLIGGAGEFVANVIETANFRIPITREFSGEVGNERNSLGMNGAGLIELLAREMSMELIAIRTRAIQQAVGQVRNVTVPLVAKGVDFGQLTVTPTGATVPDAIRGVDPDLIITFSQKGIIPSLRLFSNFAYNSVSGMQSVETFGVGRTGTRDFDRDGIADELTVGDITAATIFQAALSAPGRVFPATADRRRAMDEGERTFSRIGCATCHVPALPLNSTVFTEPGPFNPPGNLQPADVPKPFSFDLLRDGQRPRLQRDRNAEGQILVHAFTDLKRHVIGDADYPHFLNEKVVQEGVPTNQFLTRKLWDAGSSDPYGHRGDLTTLTEAIINHGGEARASRDAFAGLSASERAGIIEFLKSMQVLPESDASFVGALSTNKRWLTRLRSTSAGLTELRRVQRLVAETVLCY
ncbi:MAG: di-heme oxidoredictase family protein [Bryobacteraceae bacterium]